MRDKNKSTVFITNCAFIFKSTVDEQLSLSHVVAVPTYQAVEDADKHTLKNYFFEFLFIIVLMRDN